ncbi:MAG: YjbQ family protein [Bacteroidetes bacterium]|nr:YjbQ family protein [Bacteroidota bacterium]
MNITTDTLNFSTKGFTDIIDLTPSIQSKIEEHGYTEGSVLVFCIGSTASLTTVEFEPGLVKTDLPEFFEKLAPYKSRYAHHDTWHDDNGASHVRASLLGSNITIPFKDCRLLLGTWQQVIFVDFDTGPRDRTVIVQLSGVSSLSNEH